MINKTERKIWDLQDRIARNQGLSIWDVRIVKEGPQKYLRIFIDREQGVTIEDCENFSRAIDKPLDDLDPIKESYCLEVSSPGIERELTRDVHFEKSLGLECQVLLIRPTKDKIKEFYGRLCGFNRETISIDNSGKVIELERKNIAHVKLVCNDLL